MFQLHKITLLFQFYDFCVLLVLFSAGLMMRDFNVVDVAFFMVDILILIVFLIILCRCGSV